MPRTLDGRIFCIMNLRWYRIPDRLNCYHKKECINLKTPRIETDRLLLREIQETDVNDIFGCWMQDENVPRYMCWKASYDIAETQSFVRFELEQIENENWNRWIIVLREIGQIIGTCLVFYNEDDVRSHWDISYNLGKKYWGERIHYRGNEGGYAVCGD